MKKSDVRHDDFDGLRIHTLVRGGRPCWLLFEVERALREEVRDFDTGLKAGVPGLSPFEGEDFERLQGSAARDLLERTDHPIDGVQVIVLYESGLTLACAGSVVGHGIRRKLLKEAAEPILREQRRASFRQRLKETLKQIELEERAEKVALLHRLITSARTGGLLRDDDDAYVTCMTIVAELATGLVFPSENTSDVGLATRMGEPLETLRAVLGGEELNT